VSSTPKQEPSDEAARVLGALLLDEAGSPSAREAEWCALVVAIGARDQSALRELYDRTHRIVFTLIVRLLKDPEMAEEVTLDVYHEIWQRSASYDPARAPVLGWIMNQARSRAIDRLRRQHRRKRVDDGKAGIDGSGDEIEPLPLEERRRLLASALEALTIDERRAIEAAYFEERTYVEVAERLGAPLGTIKTRIRSGLAKLRTLLAYRDDI
jgi:RNA polymerase sigma-70 factor, ECF subfamily